MGDVIKLWTGIGIIVITFFLGFFLMMSQLMSGESSVIMILFYMMVFPLIGILIGMPLIMKGSGGARLGLFGFAARSAEPAEVAYVHVPPNFCNGCGASLSSESVEWAGPLTVKCPYCGATQETVKRKV